MVSHIILTNIIMHSAILDIYIPRRRLRDAKIWIKLFCILKASPVIVIIQKLYLLLSGYAKPILNFYITFVALNRQQFNMSKSMTL